MIHRRIAIVLTAICLLSAATAHSQTKELAKEDPPAIVRASVEVFGTVVDAETGKPVEGFITQAGHFDPKDFDPKAKELKNVTWGYSETRTSSGSYSANIKWSEGWTARILADGYVPQPILAEPPPAGKERIEKVIRLQKGRVVRGRVLDHLGKPVKDVSVFAIRPNGMTVAGGKVVNSYDGEEDKSARGAKTDTDGRFELSIGSPPASNPPPVPGNRAGSPLRGERAPNGRVAPAVPKAPGLVVSSPALDAWPAPLPEGNDEAVIRLPAPTRADIVYDIEGSEEEATVFLQSLMHEVPEWKGFEIIRHISVRNQGHFELTSLPPGRYQFARSRSLRHGNIGHGQFLDRQYIDVTSDQPTVVSFARPKGARLSGSVEWEEGTQLTGVIITVRKVLPPDAPESQRLFPEAVDARLLRVATKDDPAEQSAIVGRRGLFLTERIPPGTYEVHAAGYSPLTPEQERRTGIIGPTLTASATVTVPESGAVSSLKLELKKPAARENR